MNTIKFGDLATRPFYYSKVKPTSNHQYQFFGISVIPIFSEGRKPILIADSFVGGGQIHNRGFASNQYNISFSPFTGSDSTGEMTLIEARKTTSRPNEISGTYKNSDHTETHTFEQVEPGSKITIKPIPGTKATSIETIIAEHHINDGVQAFRELPRTEATVFRPADASQFSILSTRADLPTSSGKTITANKKRFSLLDWVPSGIKKRLKRSTSE